MDIHLNHFTTAVVVRLREHLDLPSSMDFEHQSFYQERQDHSIFSLKMDYTASFYPFLVHLGLELSDLDLGFLIYSVQMEYFNFLRCYC